jgi:hypothetical protein
MSPHHGGEEEPGYPTPGWLVFTSCFLRSYSQPRIYRHNKVSKLKSKFKLKHNTKVRDSPSPEGMMTTMFPSWGATGGRTRWLVLNWCEDANLEANPSLPPPRHTILHRRRAPPPPPPPHPLPNPRPLVLTKSVSISAAWALYTLIGWPRECTVDKFLCLVHPFHCVSSTFLPIIVHPPTALISHSRGKKIYSIKMHHKYHVFLDITALHMSIEKDMS